MAPERMLPASTSPQTEADEIAPRTFRGTAGLTRFQLACMQQQISLQILGEMTRIPPPLLSNYALGRRQISRHHLPILAIALGINPPTSLRGLATPDQIFIVEDEWNENNPLPLRINRMLLPWYPPCQPGHRPNYHHERFYHHPS